MRILKGLSRHSNLSKNFKMLTDNLMVKRSIEGIDKSIGEGSSHSSGSYTKRNKYYILNIDNKDDEVKLATYKSRNSNSKTDQTATIHA